MLFLVFAIIAILGIGPFMYHCFVYREKAFREMKEGQIFPELSQLKWSVASFFFFLILGG